METCFVIAWIIGSINGLGIIFPILHILSGGLFLGAIFMATDWVTKPLTRKGRIIYAIALGVITMIIRLQGNYPEGVLFSILIMNMFVPLMDHHLRKKNIWKNKNKEKKEELKMKKSPSIPLLGIILFIICIVIAASVSFVNQITAPIITASAESSKKMLHLKMYSQMQTDFKDITADFPDRDTRISEIHEAQGP